jgi:hypothetical protein
MTLEPIVRGTITYTVNWTTTFQGKPITCQNEFVVKSTEDFMRAVEQTLCGVYNCHILVFLNLSEGKLIARDTAGQMMQGEFESDFSQF